MLVPVTTRRTALAILVSIAILVAGCTSGAPTAPQPRPSTPGTGTLVLYDTGGELGELYAMNAANLASRFGTWKAHPVAGYTAGEGDRYAAVVYIGSSGGEKLPDVFLDDALAARVPTIWINENIDQLTNRKSATRLGFKPRQYDQSPVTEVRYKGVALTRDKANTAGIRRLDITDRRAVTNVADAVHADGTTVPWGVRHGAFTYLAELPFTYISPDDRYLAFADLLFDALAPATTERHRALVRIEDVGPQSDPAQLRAIADYLAGRGVPFAVAVFAQYDDEKGVYNGGRAVHRRLRDVPELVDALKYMAGKGGTLIAHGYTHGYAGAPNPYGVSAEDFEFFRAHVGADNQVVLDGPVAEDSAAWAIGRLDAAKAEWAAVGLPAPDIFEFPHYAASAADYQAISAAVTARYERAMYFSGVLSGKPIDPKRYSSQFFPYPVRDVYGAAVIPETLGNVETQQFNQHQTRLPAQIIETARRQLVVRDGVASFFYHPFLGLQYLPQLVEGIQALGYTFVPAADLILPAPPKAAAAPALPAPDVSKTR